MSISLLRKCFEMVLASRAATVRERFPLAPPGRFLAGAARIVSFIPCWRPAIFWLCCLALAGCQSTPHHQQREQAQENWSRVRAQVKRQLAVQQYEGGHADSAALTAEEALGLDPKDPETYVVLIRALLESGDLPAAERALKAAEAQGVDSAELAYVRGVVAERTRRFSDALDHYRRARRLDATQLDYVVAEAECLVMLRRVEEARDLVLEAQDDFERDGTLDVLLGEISLVMGDDKRAGEAFRRAMPLIGPHGLPAEDFGLALLRLGYYAEALSVLQPLIERTPPVERSGAVVRGAARCYLEVNRPAEAAELIRGWLHEHPEDGSAWLLQARAALLAGEELTACRSAEMAVRLAPRVPEAHLLYAFACLRIGRVAQARAALDAALSLSPDDPLARELMAQVQAQPG